MLVKIMGLTLGRDEVLEGLGSQGVNLCQLFLGHVVQAEVHFVTDSKADVGQKSLKVSVH